jgi:hypothetical protein
VIGRLLKMFSSETAWPNKPNLVGGIKKSTNQKQEWPVAAMFINGSGQNYQSL